MKKIYFSLAIIFALAAAPAMAATKTAVPAPKAPWKAIAPKGYSPITWASAPGIASFYKAPVDNGAIDFVTRIYLPKNQINFIISTSTPINLSSTATSSQTTSSSISDISAFPNLSFRRLGSETAKVIDPSIKFLWDAAFFNMKSPYSDLSMALKYTIGATTTISGGSRSVPDMGLARRMLIINNQTGKAIIKDFDSAAFIDKKKRRPGD